VPPACSLRCKSPSPVDTGRVREGPAVNARISHRVVHLVLRGANILVWLQGISRPKLDFLERALDFWPLFVLREPGDRDLRQLPISWEIGFKNPLGRLDRVARYRGNLRHRRAGLGHPQHGGASQIARLRVRYARTLGDAPEPLIEAAIFHRPTTVR